MKLQNKALLTGLIMASIVGSTAMAAGVNNTVDTNATAYGAESYGKSNTITATGTSAFAVGFENEVAGANSFAYGHKNKATGINSFAGGEEAEAKGYNSLAIGSSAQALSANTFAIGSQARTIGTNTVAIGNGAYASNDNALAVGAGTKANGKDSIAVGSYVKSNSANNVAIGTEVTINSSKSVGIGNGIITNQSNSVAVGNGVTNTSDNSIGLGNGVTANNNAIAIGNGTGANNINTIAIGNGIDAKSTTSIAIGYGLTTDGNDSVNIGNINKGASKNSVLIGAFNNVNHSDHLYDPEGDTLIGNANTVQNGYYATVLGKDNKIDNANYAVAIGHKASVTSGESVAIGHEAKAGTTIGTSSADIAGKTYEFAGATPVGTVSIGDVGKERTVTNVAAGRISDTSTDAINGSQLYAVVSEVAKNKQNIKDLAVGVNMLGDVVKENQRNIKDVASAVNDLGNIVSDHETAIAENKQAAADAMVEAKKHTTVVDGDNVVITTGANAAGGKEYTVSVKKDLTDMNSVAFGANTDPKHSVANKDGMITFDGDKDTKYSANGMDIEDRNNLDTASYNLNGVQASSNGKDIRFSTNGITAGNQIINNVKAGEADTDAVNVSQLKKTDAKADANKATIDTLNQKVVANTADIRALEHTTLDHEGRITTLESENKDIKGAISDNSKLIDKNTKDITKNTSDIKVLDSKIDSVGRNALERANHYTDLQVNKGVAKASALAGLKFLDYNPKDKWSFAASVGHYRNANAVAVGAAYQPNENTMIHGGVTLDGEVAYNLGVSFKTGGQKQVTRHELEEQIRQLENNNIRMQEELNEIRSMLEKK